MDNKAYKDRTLDWFNVETMVKDVITEYMKPLADMVREDRDDYSILNNHFNYMNQK